MAAFAPGLLRVALLLLLAGACAQHAHHMTHASARAAGARVTPIRGDYIGTQLITNAPCINGLTCSPSQVRRAAKHAPTSAGCTARAHIGARLCWA